MHIRFDGILVKNSLVIFWCYTEEIVLLEMIVDVPCLLKSKMAAIANEWVRRTIKTIFEILFVFLECMFRFERHIWVCSIHLKLISSFTLKFCLKMHKCHLTTMPGSQWKYLECLIRRITCNEMEIYFKSDYFYLSVIKGKQESVLTLTHELC